MKRILIMGAAGRDFHNFNVAYRSDSTTRVVAFTAAQIPNIAGRTYPAELAGPAYPDGIPIRPEEELESLIQKNRVDQVVFAYSDVAHEEVMHAASRALAAGADFLLLGPESTMLRSPLPVVAVCATRTGAGKSQTARFIAKRLRDRGLAVAVVRHPMPYGDLGEQAVQRFSTLDDLDRARCTIEEREEYEPHLEAGFTVFAGVDYAAILEAAAQKADVIVWDGGNNDFPFVRPNLLITVLDPLRAGDETRYHPGETNLRMADVALINKVNAADEECVAALTESVRRLNPDARLLRARSVLAVDHPDRIRGRRVLVVEDGPTLTHGQMAHGAGYQAAKDLGADIIDPRPHARGSLKETFARHPHLGAVVPAMGYGPAQIRDLTDTIRSAAPDAIACGTPIDLARLLGLDTPVARVRYALEEEEDGRLTTLLDDFLMRLQR